MEEEFRRFSRAGEARRVFSESLRASRRDADWGGRDARAPQYLRLKHKGALEQSAGLEGVADRDRARCSA
jgi:hypothetical protein